MRLALVPALLALALAGCGALRGPREPAEPKGPLFPLNPGLWTPTAEDLAE